MYEFKPMTDRVKKIREKYRNTRPKVDINRYRLVTEFYMNNPQLTGILKRAKNLRNLFENMPVHINEDEVIVGWQGASYRCCALYPETSFNWFMKELRAGTIPKREQDPYDIDPEDEKYLLETGDFWDKNSMSAIVDEYMPRYHRDNMTGNGVLFFGPKDNCQSPVGHFVANFWTATQKGFGAIQREAEEKMRKLEEDGIYGDSIYKYNFYRAVSIVSEGLIHWSKRYGKECERLAELEKNPERKAELLRMADTLNWIMENPCRNFHDAVQCIYLYQLAMCMDGQQHGISYGRVDQYLGHYYEQDIANGTITPEYAQEILDLFYLKVAECNKIWSEGATKSGPGYTSGQLMTLGGVDKDGNDATNAVTYMMLQSAGRLVLHDPPQALRIHDGTPDELWEAAIETTKRCGGVPTFESDKVIIPALMKRGIPLEDARNYCLNGCVEPSVGGYEWAQPGGTGTESYLNIANAFLLAINNGINPMRFPGGPEPKQTGPATGYLYEMTSMDQVLEAVKTQFDFFCKWQISCINAWESMASFHNPLPMVSATLEGCMENGKDCQAGGAKYNSTGNSCIGLGNVADSLNIIDYVCFREKIATTRELYDAIMANWEGYEELRQIINGRAPRYGNGDPEADKYVDFTASTYANAINRGTGPRGRFSAGCYPVTANVIFGWFTWATPDGRKFGDPLTDGISNVQGMDKNGPVSFINSVLNFDQSEYGNGTLCNMKFHPTALKGEGGTAKLRAVMQSYFDGGGMELQLNIVSSDTLRDAQVHPENYKDLVVRVAGFSAYFVEVFKGCQDDLIRRTEMGM
ncbi:MAG: pyruvate formate lyase family protein [Clostridiales bacterium]|nr:pyruvate formate lyase family protein [Clostridiales bacterium]